MIEVNALIVAVLICLPAVVMAARQSTWLIDYLFFVVALNRGIRRIVDYNNGYFNQFSLISLTPIIVGGLAVLVVLFELNRRDHRFGRRTSHILYLYGGAVSFAFLVGFINTKFAAVYALGDYIAPIGLMGYAALWAHDDLTINRWCNSFAASVVVVAVYGIWQFYTIPPWDAFWLAEVDFVGYMGFPEPTEMTLFSTMAERGPAASYLCSGLILLALRPHRLSVLRWPAVLAVGYAMLLTYSRTVVIFAGLAVLLYPLLNRGAGKGPVLVVAAAAMLLGPSLLARLPGQAAARMETIGSIQQDGSFQGRLQILAITMRSSLTQPWGLGIGSHGMASRVQGAVVAGSGDSTGYIEALRTFGWLGFVVIVVVLVRLWRASSELVEAGLDDPDLRLFRAWFIAGMVALFSGNWLFSASFFWVLAGYCVGRCDDVEQQELAESFDDQELDWEQDDELGWTACD